MASWASVVGISRTPAQRNELIKKSAEILKKNANSRSFDTKGYNKLLNAIGNNAKVVMIGEASHGTFEYYNERAEITKRLISEKQFTSICLESDWPDTFKINRFVHGEEGMDAKDALSEFKRFPRWMWRNEVMLDFVQWLRDYNSNAKQEDKVGIYGMDLYSFFESAHEVISYLESISPEAAQQAKERYKCFQSYKNTRNYTLACAMKAHSCEAKVTKQLTDMIKRYESMKRNGDKSDIEVEFYNKMNAIVVKDAEAYYRKSYSEDTWNLRDTHMVDTVEQILKHVNDQFKAMGSKKEAKVALWAHNSHLGDASQTEMSTSGETNVGELVRKRFGKSNTFNIGFTSHTGTVTASADWDGEQQRKKVNPSLPESFERILHDSQLENFYLIFRSNSEEVAVDPELVKEFSKDRLERFIGVIYRPDTEKASHYSSAKMSTQFDAVIHLDETRALKALSKSSMIVEDEEDTWPTGL